mmetsp:Transcript_3178/g.3429  ORF Transcript_3178/g.3429 Transcript_3178/m.3429 type:complete len:97 (+) Transcript_3178:730-1020(+)
MILFNLLVGKLPFNMCGVRELQHQIKSREMKFPETVSVSEEARDLISQLLHPDPAQRPTVNQIEGHALLRKYKRIEDHFNKWEGLGSSLKRKTCKA